MPTPIEIVIPFKLQGAKSRLAPVLTPDERNSFALAMLEDVMEATLGLGSITVLSRSALPVLERDDHRTLVSSLDLNDALNWVIDGLNGQDCRPDLMVVMADLALIDGDDIRGMMATEGDVVLSPGRGGGTNMILIRTPLFHTCYRGSSFIHHREEAERLGLSMGIYASYRSGCDIDEPSDIGEVLIHGNGRSRRYIEGLGFVLIEDGGRTIVNRFSKI
ncbi:MAG: 2-phospho-L-lactate guanylyltransferase [Methanotrichaceae archaeon]|nr:2-phospho-L-lactate guanylyltransferase [Methanotrichaceae archaeon]